MADLAEKWFGQLEGKSPSTVQAYRDRLDRQVLPALGSVRVRELSVGLLDRHLAAVRAVHGPALAKMTKSVISGMCALACRHDALRSNPCRDVARIPSKSKRAPQSLTVGEVKAVRTWLSDDAKARDRDLPDLVAFMVATGLRIGEACAITWSDVDVDAGTVTVSGTVLRVKSQGLVVSRPKSAAGERVLELPSWCVDLLRRREASSGPVFPAPRSRKLRDPSNTRRALREAFLEMGMPGVTSHAFRKTVATLMDEAGLRREVRPTSSGTRSPRSRKTSTTAASGELPERHRSSSNSPEPIVAAGEAGRREPAGGSQTPAPAGHQCPAEVPRSCWVSIQVVRSSRR